MFTNVVNGQEHKMHQMYTESNLRYYELWLFLQLYAVVFLRWPKQPHHWESVSQENKKLRPNKKQLRRLCGATVLCHITWSNSFHCFAMSQQITRRFFARKRFLIHEIDTACIPESTEGNLIRGYRLSFCWMQAPCTHTHTTWC